MADRLEINGQDYGTLRAVGRSTVGMSFVVVETSEGTFGFRLDGLPSAVNGVIHVTVEGDPELHRIRSPQ